MKVQVLDGDPERDYQLLLDQLEKDRKDLQVWEEKLKISQNDLERDMKTFKEQVDEVKQFSFDLGFRFGKEVPREEIPACNVNYLELDMQGTAASGFARNIAMNDWKGTKPA